MDALQLKATLVATGVGVPDALRTALGLDRAETAAIDLTLPGGVMASVPVLEAAAGPAHRLIVEGDGLLLDLGGPAAGHGRIAVARPAVAGFGGRTTARGVPMHRIAERRGRVLVVTPLGRCGYSITGRPCTFCIEGGRPTATAGARPTPSDVIETVVAAAQAGRVDVVLFTTDSVEGEDGGLAFLAPYVQAVRRHTSVLVAAHLHPPRTTAWVDRAYALGLDAISYGLEIFDEDALARLCVGRARYIGRERYLEMLARAAVVFPRGAVWADLALGVEPAERTRAGIDLLASMGVVPVLGIPRAPDGGRHHPDPSALPALAAHLDAAVRLHRIPTTWVGEIGTGITPGEARRAAGGRPARSRGRAAGLAARGTRALSGLRRRLRVRRGDPAAGH